MKRIVAILLVICMLFTLVMAGCKRPKPVTKPEPEPETPEEYGIEIPEKGTYQIDFANLKWMKLDADLIAELNKMEPYSGYGNNPKGMVTGDTFTEPDLSALTGGGLYIAEVTNSEYDLMITEMTWTGSNELTETFYREGQIQISKWKGNEAFATSESTGFSWGAYVDNSDAEENTVIMDQHWEGRLQFRGICQNEKKDKLDYIPIAGNKNGSYCYTIFDENGGNQPTKTVTDMATGAITVTFDYEQGNAFPEKIRVLIRDKNGEWFLSAGGTATKQ